MNFSRRFRKVMVHENTDICIEGFPRSANSFAVRAFPIANPNIKVSSHIHVTMQIIKAVNLSIPVLFLLRDPLDSLSSLLIVDPALSQNFALWSWLNLHKQILTVKEEKG